MELRKEKKRKEKKRKEKKNGRNKNVKPIYSYTLRTD
jgi:hypothetical protein